jgi:3-hydroxyisobutyrate dehydrogenase
LAFLDGGVHGSRIKSGMTIWRQRWHASHSSGLATWAAGWRPNLAKAGHEVRAFDLSEQALDKAKRAACLPMGSAVEAVRDAEAVITMLPAGKHVRDVYEANVIGEAPTGAILIDCSTIDVAPPARKARKRRPPAMRWSTRPSPAASPRPTPARSPSWSAHRGSVREARALSRRSWARPSSMPARRLGPAAKICNNMLLGASMAATCETFVMAKKLGLDLQTFFDISSKASGQCWSMTSYCPVPGVGPETPADRDYEGGFAAALMLKDLRLAMEAAQSVGAYTPMGAEAETLYARFADLGGGTRISRR